MCKYFSINRFFLISLFFLVSACGPAKRDPITATIGAALSVPSAVLSVPSAILKGDPSIISKNISNNVDVITGQCTETANVDNANCQNFFEKKAQQKAQDDLNTELSRLKTLPLRDLDNYYDQQIVKNPDAQPKAVVELVKNRLVQEHNQEGTFQGALRAANISGNQSYVTKNTHLVKTLEDKKGLEQFTVLHTADLNEIFDVDFKPILGASDRVHHKHMGIFADHSDEATRKISGSLSVFKAKNSPVKLSLGAYKLTIKVTFHLPSQYFRQSSILGNADHSMDYTESVTVTTNLTAPNMKSNVTVDFGNVQTAMTKRGSMGGVEARKPTGEPKFEVDVIKAESI